MRKAKILIIGLLTVVLLAGLVFSFSWAKTKEEEKLLIVAVGQYFGIDFFIPTRTGGFDAAEKYGVDFTWLFPTDYDIMEMITIIETVLAKGEVDGFVLEAGDPDVLIPVLKRIKEAGIPMVCTNELYEHDYFDGFCGADGIEIGKMHGKLVEKNLLGEGVWAKAVGYKGTGKVEGKIAYLTDAPGALNIEMRIKGARDYLNQFPGIVDVGLYDATVDIAKGKEVVTNILTAHPDLAAIISPIAPGTTAVGMVVQEMGLTGKVIVAGMTPLPQTLELVKSKAIASLVCQEVYDQGYLPVKHLCEYLLNNKPIPRFMPGGFEIVTLENLDEVLEREQKKLGKK